MQESSQYEGRTGRMTFVSPYTQLQMRTVNRVGTFKFVFCTAGTSYQAQYSPVVEELHNELSLSSKLIIIFRYKCLRSQIFAGMYLSTPLGSLKHCEIVTKFEAKLNQKKLRSPVYSNYCIQNTNIDGGMFKSEQCLVNIYCAQKYSKILNRIVFCLKERTLFFDHNKKYFLQSVSL